jgi:hypothetical protein
MGVAIETCAKHLRGGRGVGLEFAVCHWPYMDDGNGKWPLANAKIARFGV